MSTLTVSNSRTRVMDTLHELLKIINPHLPKDRKEKEDVLKELFDYTEKNIAKFASYEKPFIILDLLLTTLTFIEDIETRNSCYSACWLEIDKIIALNLNPETQRLIREKMRQRQLTSVKEILKNLGKI